MDNLPERVRIRGSHGGERASGRRRGHRRHDPKRRLETWRKGQRPEVGQKGTPGQWGHEENQAPTDQHSGGGVKVFRIRLESEGATKDPLTYPFKNSHQNLLD